MNLALWAVRSLRNMLIFCGIICVLQSLCLWRGYISAGYTHPVANAMASVADELMTLGSPDQLENTNIYLHAGRYIGWLVSLVGWLLIPVLHRSNHRQGTRSCNDELWELRMNLRRRGIRGGLSEPGLSQYVENEIERINKLGK